MISQVSVDFIDKFLNSNTVAVIVGALSAGWFGFKQYRSQKIWENIEDKYFKRGIEDLISYLNNLRTIVEHNYFNSLRILKYFRDLDYTIFLNRFNEIDDKQAQSISAEIPYSFIVLNTILNDLNFTKLYLSIFPTMSSINDYYITDMMLCLGTVAKEPKRLTTTKKELVEKLLKESQKRYDEMSKELRLYDVIVFLENILFRLREMNIDSYKKLKNINKDLRIQNLLRRLEKDKALQVDDSSATKEE